MTWRGYLVANDGTHHVDERGAPVYAERFDEVLKFHEPGLAPVRRRDLAWHIRADGTAAYARRFGRTFGFYEGVAAVVDADGWHHIKVDGQEAYRQRYAWCGNVQGGRCPVREGDGSYHHIDIDGRSAYPARWRYAGDFRDGVAVVQAEHGRSTHIDRHGVPLHDRWFDDLDVFHKGFARARDDEGWTHIDMRGRAVYARRFAAVEPFYNGQSRVERFDGALEVIDESGRTIVELRPARRSELAALSSDMVGFWRTQTIAAAVRLGVPDALPGTEDTVRRRCGLRIDGAGRLLRALVELHLAARDGECWALTPRGEHLRAGHPMTLADAAVEYAGPLSRGWEDLTEALRADSRWSPPDVFGDVARDEARRESHHRMLRSYARHDYPAVVPVLGLRGNERIVDAGGGLGVLARLVLDAHPEAHVIVLDRPEVVVQGRGEGSAPPGLDWRAADLFEPWGVEADVVLLSRVLHDWDDERATCILRRARAALPRSGRVLVVEMLLPEDGVSGALCDLHLLMATGGRERSGADFERLLEAAGFHVEGVRRTAALPAVVVGVAS